MNQTPTNGHPPARSIRFESRRLSTASLDWLNRLPADSYVAPERIAANTEIPATTLRSWCSKGLITRDSDGFVCVDEDLVAKVRGWYPVHARRQPQPARPAPARVAAARRVDDAPELPLPDGAADDLDVSRLAARLAELAFDLAALSKRLRRYEALDAALRSLE